MGSPCASPVLRFSRGAMVGNAAETDVMIYDDLMFDSFDELLNFSVDEEDEEAAAQLLSDPLPCPTWEDDLCLQPPPPPAAPVAGSASNPDQTDLLCDDLDVAELEWLSQFVEESFSPCTTVELPAKGDNHHVAQYRTPSPVSVLQNGGYHSSSSSSSPASSSSSVVLRRPKPPLRPEPTARGPRTKRPRPSSFSPSTALIPFSTGDEAAPAAEEEYPGGQELDLGPTLPKSKKKAKKPKPETPAVAGEEPAARRCMHCDVQKTPQWRAGPMGPKTLCNACGVRYKSGRLFPEYRPAASPTFSTVLHSNSHKKVVEMRNKGGGAAEARAPVALKGCELLNYIVPGGRGGGA